MPSERPDESDKRLYLRTVPDRPDEAARGHLVHYDRSGFSNSSINRDAHRYADQPNTRDFDTMLAAYMWSGGVARYQEVSSHLEERLAGSPSSLQSLINANAVFAFDWRGSLWLPMFQFKRPEMFVNPPARKVLAELAGVFDGWSMAVWYLQQNSWLRDRRPIDWIERHPSAVLSAARGDRFIATDSLQRLQ